MRQRAEGKQAGRFTIHCSPFTVHFLLLALLSSFLFPLSSLGFAQNNLVEQLRQAAQQNQQLQQQQQARIAALNRDLANLDAATQQQLEQFRNLEVEITRLEGEKRQLEEQIELLKTQQQQTEARIQGLEQELAGLKQRLSTLVNSLHREKAARYLPLLRAQSFTDLAVRSRWVGILGSTQTDIMGRISNTVRSLGEEKSRLQLLVNSLNQTIADRDARIAQLNQNQQNIQTVVSNLRRQSVGRQVLLRESLTAQQQLRREFGGIQGRISTEIRRIAEERRRLEAARQARIAEERRRRAVEAARIARLRAEEARAARIAEERRQAQANQQAQQDERQVNARSVPRELVGGLAFPLPGGRITAQYGSGGNDYQTIEGSSGGQRVIAANGGLVLQTFFVSNYGYTISIQHSERVITVYTNVQDLQVSAGQRVSRGQTIGYTGGGVLIPSEQLWFSVAIINDDGNYFYVNPSRYY